MSALDIYEGDFAQLKPAARPTGFVENVEAGFRSTKAYGLTTSEYLYKRDLYDGILGALKTRGRAVRGVFGLEAGLDEVAGARLETPAGSTILGSLWSEIEAERKTDPGFLAEFPSRAAVEAEIVRRRRRDLDGAGETMAGATFAGAVGGFVGSLGAGFLDPVSYVGAGGLTRAATAWRTILMSGARGAGINVAAELATEPVLYRDADALGIERTGADTLRDVGLAATFGFGMDAGGAAVGEALRRWRGRGDLTPIERDAIDVGTREHEVLASSPFDRADPIATAAHVETLSKAMRAMELGEPLPPAPAAITSTPVDLEAIEAAAKNLSAVDEVTGDLVAAGQMRDAERRALLEAADLAVNPYATRTGGEPPAPRTFSGWLRSYLVLKSKEATKPVRIELESAISHGVPAELLKGRGSLKGVFSSKYGALDSRDEIRITLDNLGDVIDPDRWGIEPRDRESGRLSPEEIGEILQADIEGRAGLADSRIFEAGKAADRLADFHAFEARRQEFEAGIDRGDITLGDVLDDEQLAALDELSRGILYDTAYPDIDAEELAGLSREADRQGAEFHVDGADDDDAGRQLALRDAPDGQGAGADTGPRGAGAEDQGPASGEPGARRAEPEDRAAPAGAAADAGDFAARTAESRLEGFDDPRGAAAETQTQLVEHDVVAASETPFGPSHPELAGDWQAAVAQLSADEAGEVPGALFHTDVGPIDLIWGRGGENGFGLAHIIEKHPEVVAELPQIVSGLRIASQTPGRVRLESGTHFAVVSLNYEGVRKHWLLTAFERKGKASGATDDGPAAPSPRGRTSSSPPRPTDNVGNSDDIVEAALLDAPGGADPQAAVLQRQKLQLQANGPSRARVDQEDVTGLALFERDLFAIGAEVDEDGAVRARLASAEELLEGLDADQAALTAVRGCLE